MARDPQLPELQVVADWIRQTRDEVGLTQVELGEEAHISPSQLSRLESADGNPSYEAVYRVYTTLKQHQEHASLADILRRKRDREVSGPLFEYVAPSDSCAEASELMDRYKISQLPVIDEGDAVGSVTETELMPVEDLAGTAVEEIAGPPFPEVPVTTTKETAQNLLQTRQALLLTDGNDEGIEPIVGQYVGLVTAADFRNTGE